MRSDIGNSKNGYQVRKYNDSVKRYCQTLDLKDNPELIEEYVNSHSKLNSWPEIRAGIREVGILEMEIYIYNSRLFMIVETPLDFDWDTAMEKLAHLPRQAEWEECMSVFQVSKPGASATEKWTLMDRMFYLYN